MKKIIRGHFVLWMLITASLCALPQWLSAQVWNLRSGYGQPGTTNGLSDEGRAICTDAAGNVYITGKISDDLVGNTVSFGGAPLVSAGDDDGFVAKFNADGVHQWSIRFGGTQFFDIGNGIATDGNGVYVVGTAGGAMTVGTSPTSYPAPGTAADGLIMKLNANTGALEWLQRFGSGSADEAQAVCLDNAGNVYVSGIFRTRQANPIVNFGSFPRTVQGNAAGYTSDVFIAKLNPAGAYQWVSTGGITGYLDNTSGSGICYVPGLDQVITVGSMRANAGGNTQAVYSTATPSSVVILNNNTNSVLNEDFVVLRLSAGTGAFLAGSAVGSTGNEAGLSVTYDPYSGDVFFAGYYSSASTTFPGVPAITNAEPGNDNIMYGRFNPNTDTYVWVRDTDNSDADDATDVARTIVANGYGRVLITGRFNNTITWPGGLSQASSGALTDIFVARADVVTGNVDYVTQGTGTHISADDIGYGIAPGLDGNFWITGVYASFTTFGSLPPLTSSAGGQDIFLARFADPPTIITNPSATNVCLGSPAVFGIVADGVNATYSWQEATNATFTTGLVNLTNAGVYSGANTNELTISNTTGLNGRYYRAIASNAGGSMVSSGAPLTLQDPTLAGNSSVTQNVSNNRFYSAGCGIVATVMPAGASPVSGTVTARVWVEASVPEFGPDPFVQRHYEIMPAANAATATARVTLYFSQAEFDNFNAHPAVTLPLPTAPGDATGIANLRIGKYPGTSSNGTGLPGTYTGTPEVIDPADVDITYNATFNRWEVTIDVTGFSGFVIQTEQSPLPVNLESFSAQWQQNDVRLLWKTAGESEHSHFEIERSENGNQFRVIGQVPGNNGSNARHYQFTDAGAGQLAANKLYYRLRMVSTSGAVTHSRIVIVPREQSSSLLTGIMPNPFKDVLTVGIHAPRNGRMNIYLLDMAGRRLTGRSFNIDKGLSTQSLDGLGALGRGVYTLVLEFDGKTSTYKVIK